MSRINRTKPTASVSSTDRRARREARKQRIIRRDAVYGNELKFALDEARTLRQFKRLLVDA